MPENQKTEQIQYSGNSAVFRLNPKIYPIDVVHSAAYIMIDKAFILLDGDPEKEIIVSIECKEGVEDIKKTVQQFNDELLSYSVYKTQNKLNQGLKEAIMKRVLITNQVIDCLEEIKNETQNQTIKDPEGIFKTWEENEDGKKPKNNHSEQ